MIWYESRDWCFIGNSKVNRENVKVNLEFCLLNPFLWCAAFFFPHSSFSLLLFNAEFFLSAFFFFLAHALLLVVYLAAVFFFPA